MRNFKKTLSVVLAVVLVLSTMSIMAFAHTSTWTEDSSTVNLKYEVTQVPSVTMSDGTGTYTAVDNDIYAVTVYAKTPALTGIMYLQVPFQYDVNYFEPVMTIDSGDLYCAYDGWHTDIGITDVCYSLPARYTDSNAYDASGNVSTSSLKIKCYGLGHASAGTCTFGTYYYGKDNDVSTNMNAYAGLGDNIRLCALTLDDGSGIAKTAYLNAVNGLIPTDWVEMGTMYFHRVAGVSEADAVGQVIGIADGANFGTQLSTRTTTAAQPGGYLVSHVNPTYQANYVSNAVVTADVPSLPVVAKSASQVKYTPIEKAPTFATLEDDYSFRVKSVITDADWDAYFQSTNDGDESNNTANYITSVGIVAFKGTTGFDADTAKAVVAGTPATNYAAATTDYIQKTSDTSDAYFGAVIKLNKDTDTDVTYMAFVNYLDASGNAQTIFYDTSYEALLATNYGTYTADYLARLNNGSITL